MRWLHFVDSATKFPVRPGLEDLPERIDVNLITEIGIGGGAAPGAPAGAASPLSFALVNADQGPLAELLAPDAARWADWTDGLNMLRRDGGHVASAETEGFVQALTEIGLKIKLLGASTSRWFGMSASEVLMWRCRPVGREGDHPQRLIRWPTTCQLGLLFRQLRFQ
jgi:engulfment/cell motility protein 1